MGYLSTLIRAATPNNPRFSLNDPGSWDQFLDGPPAGTGVHVSRESALSYSPWWRGINLLARDVGKLPLHVYRRQGNGKERDTKHPAYRLLRYKPNDAQTALQFRMQLTAHALSGGNGYAFIARDNGVDPTALLPLDPDCTYPVRADGELHYVTEVAGSPRKLFAADVLHVMGFTWDGLAGVNVLQKAREAIGLGLGALRSQAVSLKNGGRPSVVLETLAALEDKTKQALRESWERMHSGIENQHRTAVLDRGLKASRMAFSSEDQQLIQTRQFELNDVANFLGIPVHKIGGDKRTAYASLEQENQSYLDDGLDFWLSVWEAQCWDKLLTEEEKDADDHVVEFLRAALVRSDLAARSNYYRTALGGRGWLTPNEVRGTENLNPDDSPDADTILTPLNMGQGGGQNEPPPATPPKPAPPPPPAKPKRPAAVASVLADACRRMARRAGQHAQRASRTPAEFCRWLDTFAADHGPITAEARAPAESLLAAYAGATPGVAGWLAAELAVEYGAVADVYTAKELPDGVAMLAERLETDIPDRAKAKFLGDD